MTLPSDSGDSSGKPKPFTKPKMAGITISVSSVDDTTVHGDGDGLTVAQ
jgi:hypothetical protein